MRVIKRSDDEIDRVANWANEGQDQGTHYEGKSYEDGLVAMLNWLTGDDDDAPDAN
ncbi:hypothetical protein LCGC14_0231500 [marine sediment metagenome]|uniref:Uncharacterized protein n=1 Tax=marine sediment metagenome TaxID=412755 RepID=A0A0F9URA9_9ZZZZ